MNRIFFLFFFRILDLAMRGILHVLGLILVRSGLESVDGIVLDEMKEGKKERVEALRAYLPRTLSNTDIALSFSLSLSLE